MGGFENAVKLFLNVMKRLQQVQSLSFFVNSDNVFFMLLCFKSFAHICTRAILVQQIERVVLQPEG